MRMLRGTYHFNFKCISPQDTFTCSLYTFCPGGLLSPKSYVDVPARPRKSDFLYTNYLPNFPPRLKEKHPILTKLGAFYNNLPKIHPIYVIWAPLSLMKTSQSLYQILQKSAPKGRHIYIYRVNVRTPPRPSVVDFSTMKNRWCVFLNELLNT